MESDPIRDIRETTNEREVTEGTDAQKDFLSKLSERLPTVIFGSLLCLMDILTIGRNGFEYSPECAMLMHISAMCFVLRFVTSQILTYYLSSFKIGLITSPVTESFFTFKSISALLYDLQLRDEKHFATLIFCIGISTLGTAIGYFMLYRFRAEKVLEKLPGEVGVGLFFTVGWFCFKFSNEFVMGLREKLYGNSVYGYHIPLIYNVVSVCLWRGAKLASVKYPAVSRYTYVIAVMGIAGAFYTWMVLSGWSVEECRREKLLPEEPSLESLRSSWLKDLSLSSIDFRKASKCWLTILTLPVLNIIHFPINIATIQKGCRTKANMKKELFSHGVNNLVGTFVGVFPVYIVSSSTISLNTPVRGKRVDTLLIGASVLVLFLSAQKLISLLPNICFNMLLLFISFDILWDSTLEIREMGAYCTVFSLSVAIASLANNNLATGVLVGLVIYGAKKAVYYYAKKKRTESDSFISSTISIPEK